MHFSMIFEYIYRPFPISILTLKGAITLMGIIIGFVQPRGSKT